MKQILGEEKSIYPEDLRTWLDSTLTKLLLQYESESIYNVDETTLFYKLRPDKTLSFKVERCSGTKKHKDRLTVLVGASMAAEKLPLLIIGKSKSRRCYAGVRSLPLEHTLEYTGIIFSEWVDKWNRNLLSKKSSVLIIIDNVPHILEILSFQISLSSFSHHVSDKTYLD